MARMQLTSGQNRKELILNGAAELFHKNGFKAATMRELAEKLHVEAPSLYNHFSSKIDLLREICFLTAKDFTSHMRMVSILKISSAEKTEDLIKYHIQKTDTDFDKVYVANHEWKYLSKPDLQLYLGQRKNYEKDFIRIIEDGIRKKELRKMNPAVTVLTILSSLRGLENIKRSKHNIGLKEWEANMVDQLLNGITN